MEISNRRIGIATLMSDLNIMKKVPLGRLDELCGLSMPAEVERAIELRTQGRLLEKNSKLWRQVHHFFMTLKPLGSRRSALTIGEQMQRERDLERAKAFRGPFGYYDGEVSFKKYVINALFCAGKDFYDEANGDTDGRENDLADSILTSYGDRSQFSKEAWARIRECAADHIAEGIDKARAKHEKRKAS